MRKQIKNTISILLAFCFLLSMTATASAVSPSITDTGEDFLYIGDQAGNVQLHNSMRIQAILLKF